MRAAESLAEFIDGPEHPQGRYVTGDSFVYFHAHPGLCGFVLFGRPTERDLTRLARALAVELRPSSPPHVSLVDARRVEAVDPTAFAVLGGYVAAHTARLTEVVRKLALVRPSGMIGALAAGFFRVQAPPYPVEVFEEPATALDWLGVGRDRKIVDELDAIVARATDTTPFLRDLRALLDARRADLTLSRTARALGISGRSLQRRLREHATTFQAEVGHARVRAAMVLLRETDAKLTQIALDVGCATLPHFSTLFRRVTGESPSAWRVRVRGE